MSTTITPSAAPEAQGESLRQANHPARHIALRTAIQRLRGKATGIVSVHGFGLSPNIDQCIRSIRAQVDGHRDQMLRALSSCLGEGIVIDVEPVADHIDDLAGRYAKLLEGRSCSEVSGSIASALDVPWNADASAIYQSLMALPPEERDAAIAQISDTAFATRPSLPFIRHHDETRWERAERERSAGSRRP